MAADDDEEERGGRSAAHVSRASHSKGGGHVAPNMSKAAIKGANTAKVAKPAGLIARQAANAGSWDAPSVLIDEDEDDMHPLYQGMKFADYEYREYPKFIPIEGHPGGGKIAENEDEESTLLAGRRLLREPEERVRLLQIVDTKNVPGVDKRWNIEKIKKAIVAAGHDPDYDPSR